MACRVTVSGEQQFECPLVNGTHSRPASALEQPAPRFAKMAQLAANTENSEKLERENDPETLREILVAGLES